MGLELYKVLITVARPQQATMQLLIFKDENVQIINNTFNQTGNMLVVMLKNENII